MREKFPGRGNSTDRDLREQDISPNPATVNDLQPSAASSRARDASLVVKAGGRPHVTLL